MKKIAISMRNRVFMESIFLMLKQTDNFRPIGITSLSDDVIIETCLAENPEIFFMDVTPGLPETGMTARLSIIESLRSKLPNCRFVLLCDETAYPDLAKEVMRARQSRQIDAFFYASVTADYLMAALNSL